ncbi:MAG: DUF4340 domain-containing protein, partial [Deltaproteobacteria bacterium]|nr:DUF4340 domain-containing protein [Deltaproteobacteria bacterium]
LIGKSGPDIFSTYVRSVKKNHVVLTNTILKNIFDKSINEWRDKSVISLQPEGIVEYTVSGDKTLHLKRNHDNSWRVLAPNIVSPKQQNISAIITAFAALTAASISMDNETKSGITAPVRTITALTQDGLQTTLLIGKAKNAFQHYVKASGQDTLFVLENYNLDPLCPVLETLSSNTTQSDNQTNDTPGNLPQIHEDTK